MNYVDPVSRHLFLEGIFLKYGYDFRQYSHASLNRRLQTLIRNADRPLMVILARALEDPAYFKEILPDLTINTTEFFRDPQVFVTLREKVLPVLRTYPVINVWSAGCSSGEELYSLAILFKEEGLYGRTRFYGTDVSTDVLDVTRKGIYKNEAIKAFTRNYTQAKGTSTPSAYYTSDYGLSRIDANLRDNMVITQHNLVTDEVFAEMHLILCRNVLIYFERELQSRVLEMFARSLGEKGFLCLGTRETPRFSKVRDRFDEFSGEDHIYRKVSHG